MINNKIEEMAELYEEAANSCSMDMEVQILNTNFKNIYGETMMNNMINFLYSKISCIYLSQNLCKN